MYGTSSHDGSAPSLPFIRRLEHVCQLNWLWTTPKCPRPQQIKASSNTRKFLPILDFPALLQYLPQRSRMHVLEWPPPGAALIAQIASDAKFLKLIQ